MMVGTTEDPVGAGARAVRAQILATGGLMELRVRNASQEDLMLIVGMNRLRAAYVELEPWVRTTW